MAEYDPLVFEHVLDEDGGCKLCGYSPGLVERSSKCAGKLLTFEEGVVYNTNLMAKMYPDEFQELESPEEKIN